MLRVMVADARATTRRVIQNELILVIERCRVGGVCDCDALRPVSMTRSGT
jgi:hypothetical protein